MPAPLQLDNYPHRLVVLLPQSPKQYATLSSLAPRPYTYKLIGMLGVIIVSMSLIAAGYIGVGAAGYMAFPTSVSSNILNTFPADDPIMQVRRAGHGEEMPCAHAVCAAAGTGGCSTTQCHPGQVAATGALCWCEASGLVPQVHWLQPIHSSTTLHCALIYPPQVARGVIGLMVTGHYPINFNPARVAFCDLLDTLFNVTSVSYWAEALFTVVFFAATLATAMVVRAMDMG